MSKQLEHLKKEVNRLKRKEDIYNCHLRDTQKQLSKTLDEIAVIESPFAVGDKVYACGRDNNTYENGNDVFIITCIFMRIWSPRYRCKKIKKNGELYKVETEIQNIAKVPSHD